MKTTFKFLFLFLMLPFIGRTQASLDAVIAAVKSTNKALIASRLQMEAEMREARTGIYLPNPEVQFDYLWGDPASSGNRTDFGITQSFSFPSVYIKQSNQSRLRQTGASLKYLQKEREVLLKAESDWLNIVGLNKKLSVLNHRLLLSQEVAQKAKLQLSKGEIDVIKYHHAQMEFVNLKMERSEHEVQRYNLQTGLNLLCGGKAILVNDTVFPPMTSISLNDIVGSYSGSPQVRSLENVVKVRNLDKSIAVSEWLPEFKAGYYSEVVPGLTYRGLQTGISIPLWHNINSVKTADYQIQVADAELDQLKSQEMAHLVSLFNKRDRLADQLQEIKSALLPVNDLSLLKKALDSGEINISEFYFEVSVFYTSWIGLLNIEKELALTDAELKFFTGR